MRTGAENQRYCLLPLKKFVVKSGLPLLAALFIGGKSMPLMIFTDPQTSTPTAPVIVGVLWILREVFGFLRSQKQQPSSDDSNFARWELKMGEIIEKKIDDALDAKIIPILERLTDTAERQSRTAEEQVRITGEQGKMLDRIATIFEERTRAKGASA